MRNDPYAWIDPFETMDRMEDYIHQLEDDHRRELGMMARVFADQSHEIRRRCEEVARPFLEAQTATAMMNILAPR